MSKFVLKVAFEHLIWNSSRIKRFVPLYN